MKGNLPNVEVADTAVGAHSSKKLGLWREAHVEHFFVVGDEGFDKLFVVDIPNGASGVYAASNDGLDAL